MPHSRLTCCWHHPRKSTSSQRGGYLDTCAEALGVGYVHARRRRDERHVDGGADDDPQALVLPESERAELAAKLLETLDGLGEQDVGSARVIEVERRCAELDAEGVVTGDWESLRARIARDVFGR